MLKFALTQIIFGIFIICVCLFYYHIWILVLGTAVYLTVMAYGSAYIGSGFYLDAHLKGKTASKIFALTFDDGIHTEITPKVLDILKARGISATFFLIGRHLETPQAQEILQRMLAEGHTVGNHGYSHSPFFDFYSKGRVEAELRQVHELVRRVTGSDMHWFRPPYGVTNPNIGAAVRAMGYTTIGWSLRSLDTVVKGKEQLLRRVLGKLKSGDIVLLHDHHREIVDFLPQFLEETEKRGFKVVAVGELLGGELARETLHV